MPPHQPRALGRRSGTHSSKDVVLIVCSSDEEAEYFRWAAIQLGHYPAPVRVCSSGALSDMVSLAILTRKEEKAKGSPIDRVWCVATGLLDSQDPDVLALAERKRVQIAFSNPSFKVWLALHHADHASFLDPSSLSAHLTSEYQLPELRGLFAEAASRAAMLRSDDAALDADGQPVRTELDFVIDDLLKSMQRFTGDGTTPTI